MNIWFYISLILVIGIMGILWLDTPKNKEINQLNFTIASLKKELSHAWEDEALISKSYTALKEKYEKLEKDKINMVKPTIYVERPVIDTLDVMMALPYYNKEDKETVMEQVQVIMAQRFERDLFDYVDWREEYDPIEDSTNIIARIRVLRPTEMYHENKKQ